ncbi:MAG: HAMP domain-containing histidine kinase [Ruminococcaceae bacterium]|nr:HAMP domain-containing histidine kinase [Oscillospiraceae bacterium]
MKRVGGLRRRWLINTVGVICALGLVCVIVVTMVFSAYYHNGMTSDLRYRATTTSAFFEEYLTSDYKEYYQACLDYVKGFEHKNTIELQFIDANGTIVVSSYGNWPGESPTTPDIQRAIENVSIESFEGRDPNTNERIIAVSSPVVFNDEQVIGVMRYVTSTQLLDRQILTIGLSAMCALLIIMAIVLFSSNYYIRTILSPLNAIIKKAKRITSGSYGMQIQTKFDDEIGELAQTINEMSAQISQNERIQREFISSLSHELRTPLTAIAGWSETLLAGDTLDPEAERGMKIISRETKRLTEMVVELLDFTRIQDGRFTLNIQQADIRSEFEDTVYMYSSRLTQDGIQLDYLDNDDDIPEISCDPERLRQVFLNILDNAAKHGGAGERIEASIHLEKDNVVIRIRDYGPGIPEDEIPLVKKKFYKGSSRARGTGIGLAVCDEIVELHRGTLTLENAEGGGTLVTISLPVTL